MLTNYVQTGTVTKGKKGAVSVPFDKQKSTIQYHFCGVSIIRTVSAKYGDETLTINGLR